MPFNERVTYGRLIALYLFLGYVAPCLVALFWLITIDLLMPDRDDDILIPLFIVAAFVICLVGGVFGFGAFLGAMLCPVVATKRVFWIGFVIAGCVIAGSTVLLSIYTNMVYIETRFFMFTSLAGFMSAIVMRVIGLALGWARPWFAPGMCQACGYDLRRTPAGSTCPECGALVS